MKYHVGLLSERPHQNRSYRWMRRGGWHKPDFPADVYLDLAVWLAMPGFDTNYHIHNLGISEPVFRPLRAKMPTYEDVKDQVIENWMSTTREDCIKLTKMRKTKWSPVPLICQLAMLDEVKRGTSRYAVAKMFGVSDPTVRELVEQGAVARYAALPAEFAMLARFIPSPLGNLGPKRVGI
jgi:hypothetical protein